MKPEFRNHIKNIIGKLITTENTEYNDRVCFFKHYSGFSIEEEDIINIMTSLNLECDMLYYRFSEANIQGAFCPFLSFIRELYVKYYGDMDCSEFVDKAGVYKVVEYLFISYIRDGYCRRNEDIIPREAAYETEKIIKSIVNMINYISNEHKIIFVLDSIQLAQTSSLKLMLALMKNRKINNVVIIGAYNEAYDVSISAKECWNTLMSHIKNRGMAIDYEDNRRALVENETFVPDEWGMDRYLTAINDMFLCLELEQAKYYLEIIYRAIESDNLDVDAEQKIDILNLYALVTFYNGEEKVSYVYSKKMFDIEYLKQDKVRLFNYYYVSTLISHKGGKRKNAYDCIAEAKKIAEQLKRPDLKVKIDMLQLVVILDKFPDVLLWNPEVNMPEYLVQEAIKYNQKLHLAYAYIFGFNMPNEPDYPEDNGLLGCENMPEFMAGLKLAEELGNIQIQIRAWQKSAVQASTCGRFDETVYYYGKCLKIMEGRDQKHEEAQIYNGIGYNCLINEKYDLAYDYFLKAVEIGISVDTPKYILDAVYNLAITGITVGDYDATIKYINITLKMMTSLNIERLNVCNKTKLYGLAIFSYIKVGEVYNARLSFDMMKTAMNHILSSDNPDYSMWEDDIYLFYVVNAMLDMQEKDYADAYQNFEKAHLVWNRINSKQNYILPRVIEEEARLLEMMGESEKRIKILNDAVAFCNSNRLYENAKRLSQMIDGKPYEANTSEIKLLSDNIVNEIFKMTNRCEMKLEVEKKNKMLTFFENWVDSLNDNFESVEQLISNSILMIKNTFDIDGALYIGVQDNLPVVRYSDKDIELKQYQLKFIYDYFTENGRRIIISRFQKSYLYHEELISTFNRDDISTMVAIPFVNKDQVTEIFVVFRFKKANFTENLKMFHEDEADILRTAFRELVEAINRDNIKKQLEKSSVTDILTGLYNRQGMNKCIENEIAKCLETTSTGKQSYTILYIYLDNFKYCNDNFGHDAGDAVLVAFSRMLEGIVENEGFIVRYGGDEFIIVLPSKNEAFGTEIAEKIFANIRHNKGFKKVIENLRHEEIIISENNRVTCSIGIACGNASGFQGISRILKKADDALYYVKNDTKHDYKVWESTIEK